MSNLYETNTYAWALEQAKRLRAGEEIDRINLAEEIEDLGKHQRSKLMSNLVVLSMHKLKWDIQIGKRTNSWTYTIQEHTNRVKRLIAQNPSLQSQANDILKEAYDDARLRAAAETGLDLESFPETCRFTWTELISPSQSE